MKKQKPDLPIVLNYGKTKHFALADQGGLAKGQVVQYFFQFHAVLGKMAKMVGLRPELRGC